MVLVRPGGNANSSVVGAHGMERMCTKAQTDLKPHRLLINSSSCHSLDLLESLVATFRHPRRLPETYIKKAKTGEAPLKVYFNNSCHILLPGYALWVDNLIVQ